MKVHNQIKNKLSGHVSKLAIKSLNKLNLPNALLIIPDGNRRWARSHHLAPERGHWAGGEAMVKMLNAFKDLNVKVIGFWGFGEDNWKREKHEVDNIMEVIQDIINKNLKAMRNFGIKFMHVGSRERLQKEYPNLVKTFEKAEKETSQNQNKIFAVFVDYGERWQLEEFAKARAQNKLLTTYQVLSKINNGLPLFDMVLRTSGEQRLSGFGPLAELAEFVSVKKNLPEVDSKDIILAFKDYSSRQRRIGG